MGWRGTLRAIDAASRRAERNSQRRYRQLVRDSVSRAKMEARQRTAYEVEVYENQIERLVSVHKESPEPWNWNLIYNTPPPIAPQRSVAREAQAQLVLDSFRPGFLDKLFGRVESKRQTLQQSVGMAQAQDEQEYQKIYQEYYQRHTDWEERRQLAWRIMQGDVQSFVDALEDVNPFGDISELGASIEFTAHSAKIVEVHLMANSESIVPDQIKSSTANGKLSVKPMPRTRFYEIYRDFVCGSALRAGRELFAFLPVETVLTTIQANLLNTRTGQQNIETILSVAMYRTAFKYLNFNRLDPSGAMDNFPHRMKFSKSSGFASVEPIGKDEAVQLTASRNPRFAPGTTIEKAEPTYGEIGKREGSRNGEVAAQPQMCLCTARLERLLQNHPATEGYHWLPVEKAADLANIFQKTKVTIGISRRIAERIELAGYCVEPDARYCGSSYSWEQSLGVFKPVDGDALRPTPAYLGASNLLKLCVLIAGADGGINHQELDVFHEAMQGQLYFSQTDRQRLRILEALLAQDDSSAKKALVKLAKSVPSENRQVIAQLLIKVASADNMISKSEYRALERIFNAFDLPPGTVDTFIQKIAPESGEVTIQEADSPTTGERLPASVTVNPQSGFALNMARVDAITNETREVIGILSSVMDEEEDQEAESTEESEAPCSVTKSSRLEKSDTATNIMTTGFEGLNTEFIPIFERLLARDHWSQAEFQALANEFHLMPLCIYDSINEWADEKLGDFILEGEDPIKIRQELFAKGRI
jgi:tellurite resistance protein